MSVVPNNCARSGRVTEIRDLFPYMTLTKIIYFLLINDFIKGQVHTRHTATQKHKHTFKKGKEKLVNKTKKKKKEKKAAKEN